MLDRGPAVSRAMENNEAPQFPACLSSARGIDQWKPCEARNLSAPAAPTGIADPEASPHHVGGFQETRSRAPPEYALGGKAGTHKGVQSMK